MIRRAVPEDLDSIEESYLEHFAHERTHAAYTVFQEGVYPTRMDAQRALESGALYVYVENGSLFGSIILDSRQPEEYRRVHWKYPAADGAVNVIHLLMVRPGAAGKGVGSALVKYAMQLARLRACTVIRLDTGAQNIPAASLYRKLGFQLAAASSMKVGGAIAHGEHLFFERPL